MADTKLLYFRRGNKIEYDTIGHIKIDLRNYVIIGDESEIGGRDGAYKHKGLSKTSINGGIADIDGDTTKSWPRIYPDIKLTAEFDRDYSIHEFIKSDCTDICEWCGEKDDENNPLETREAFRIFGNSDDIIISNIEELYTRINNLISGNIERMVLPPYEDIVNTIGNDILPCIYSDIKNPHIIAELTMRYGKCATALITFASTESRILVLTGYVGTIFPAYNRYCYRMKGYEKYLFFDPEKYENEKDAIKVCTDWLNSDPEHKIIYKLGLTGTFNEDDETSEYICNDLDANLTTFDKRSKVFKTLQKNYSYAITLDEVDFGAHCEKQIKKLNRLANNENCLYKLSMTGTNADKAEKIWKRDFYISCTLFDLYKVTAN